MGNKGFDKIKYKTLLTEAKSRMTIRRGTLMLRTNEIFRENLWYKEVRK
jgi:hypothetical protein